MNEKKRILTALALAATAGSASAQSFSLDDNPNFPLTSAPFAGLFSAEDPWGLFLPATAAGLIGPSPTLAVGFTDGDILEPQPALGLPVLDVQPPAGSYVNALSADHERIPVQLLPEIAIRFSVDRATQGFQGSDLFNEANLNQQPGDIYTSEKLFPHPGLFAGTLGPGPFAGLLPPANPGAFALNTLDIDESQLMLTAGLGVGNLIGPNLPAPPIVPGRHDNVDAFNDLPLPFQTLDLDGDLVTDTDYFFSIPPAQAVIAGQPCAGIYFNATGFPGGLLIPFALPGQMGLDVLGFPPNSQFDVIQDDIDALVVWDRGQPMSPTFNQAEAVEDFALFSLSPGSASLQALRNNGLPVDASTVFFTDFTGAFAVYCFGSQIGIADTNVGDDFSANVDALAIGEPEEDKCPGDVNGDGSVDPADFTAWLQCFNDPTSAPFCPCADVNGDGAIDPADFTAWLAAFAAGC